MGRGAVSLVLLLAACGSANRPATTATTALAYEPLSRARSAAVTAEALRVYRDDVRFLQSNGLQWLGTITVNADGGLPPDSVIGKKAAALGGTHFVRVGDEVGKRWSNIDHSDERQRADTANALHGAACGLGNLHSCLQHEEGRQDETVLVETRTARFNVGRIDPTVWKNLGPDLTPAPLPGVQLEPEAPPTDPLPSPEPDVPTGPVPASRDGF